MIWIAPVVLLTGCSKTNPTNTAAQQPTTAAQQQATEQQQPGSVPAQLASARENANPLMARNAALESPGNAAAADGPAAARRPAMVIPRGTALRVRVDQTLDTRRNHAGDSFSATLAQPVVLHGNTVLPRGTVFTGHVTESQASGHLKGRAVLSLRLDSFRLNGRQHRVETHSVARVSSSHKKRNLGLIGGGGGLGAALGAIAGGGKGALIGAGAGAAAGTAGAAATGKKDVEVPAESTMTFSLAAPLRLE
ncbi:MAG TPA: hypothetical protein VG675_20355 [Bryobacteraceae bacterium]|nr:hypothetical protein [Bryobacteraceae bacterium]